MPRKKNIVEKALDGVKRAIAGDEPVKRRSATKRTKVGSAGARGGARYVRRKSGRFTKDQTSVGRSLAADKRRKARTKAKKGMKDRGD